MRIAIALLSLLAWSGIAAEPELADYAAKQLAFSLQYPKSWERLENISGAAVALIAPRDNDTDAFRENVNVITHELPRDTTLEKFAGAQLSGVEKTLKDYAVESKSEIAIGTLKALKIVYTCTQQKLKLKCVVLLAVSGERGFVLTCSAEAAAFEKYKADFDQIINSFKTL